MRLLQLIHPPKNKKQLTSHLNITPENFPISSVGRAADCCKGPLIKPQ